MRLHPVPFLAAVLAAGPAFAAPRTGADVFADAAVLMKLVMLLLIAGAVAAVVMIAAALARPAERAATVQRLRGLTGVALLLGFFGAAYVAVNMSIGLSNVTPTPPMQVLAPGFAEGFAILGLAFLAAALAAAGRAVLAPRAAA